MENGCAVACHTHLSGHLRHVLLPRESWDFFFEVLPTHSWSSPQLHIAKALVNCMDMHNYIHETNIYPKNLPKTLFDLSGNCPCSPRPPGRSRSSGWRGYPRGQQATAETSAGLTTMA